MRKQDENKVKRRTDNDKRIGNTKTERKQYQKQNSKKEKRKKMREKNREKRKKKTPQII